MQDNTVRCVIQWLKIRADSGKDFPGSVEQLEDIINHSALLPKLIRGEEPLIDPPPLSNNYPWYDLIERGMDITYKVTEGGHWHRHIHGGDVLFINEYPWKIVKKTSDDDYTVTYGNGRDHFRAYVFDDSDTTYSGEKIWRIERVTNDRSGRICI